MTQYETANDPDRVLKKRGAVHKPQKDCRRKKEPAKSHRGTPGKSGRAPLTVKRLREVLDYNPETGVFTWKKATSNRSKTGDRADKLSAYGYRRVSVFSQRHQAHRLAMFLKLGYWPKEVDHINRNKGDNRLSNLREVTRQQNTHNTGLRATNTTGITGVYLIKKSGRWRAQIRIGDTHVHLGYSKYKEEAIKLRKAAELYYYPEIYKLAGTRAAPEKAATN